MFCSLDKSLLYPKERRFIPLSGHRYKIFVFEIYNDEQENDKGGVSACKAYIVAILNKGLIRVLLQSSTFFIQIMLFVLQKILTLSHRADNFC